MTGTWSLCARGACFLVLGLIALLGTAGPAAAQKAPPGFQVDLIYRAPDVEHPSVVTCDDQGNLFVGEDPMDMRGPTTKEIDRVLLIRWDKTNGQPTKTVFCDQLSAVFGLVWHDGALYVMHAPHYTMFKDTNGDGVADVRKDLADGFGPPAGVYGFNDHIVTGTRLGMDGNVYVSVGDKGIPRATGSDGSTISLEGGGVVRMRLDGSKLEVVTSGTRNHLDVAMDSLDNIFTYDNTDDGLGWWTRFTHHVPSGYYGYPYDYHPHADRHLPRISEHGGGSPVGADCYREAAWPEKYRNSPFHCEWGKGKVQRFALQKNGASFTAEIEDFLVGDGKEEFKPLDVCFSPDGKSMYVADWNFGGWVNPKVCGRLFRVTYVGGDVPAEPPRAKDSDPLAAQLKSLGHPAHSERMRAQHAIAKLTDLPHDHVVQVMLDTKQPKDARIHAIWTQYEAVDRLDFDPVQFWSQCLRSDADVDVRGQAARVLGEHRDTRAVDALVKALSDAEAGVRMRAAIALGRIRSATAASPLLAALGEQDVYARFTIVQALRAIGDWKDVKSALQSSNPDVRIAAVLALTGVYDDAAVASLAWAGRESHDPAVRVKAIEAIADVHRKADPYEKGWWGTQPARGVPARPKKHEWSGTPLVMSTLRDALKSNDDAVRQAAMRALGEIKDPAAIPLILAMAEDAKLSMAMREDAVKGLVNMKAEAAAGVLAKFASDDQASPALVALALDGIAALKVQSALSGVEHRLSSPESLLRVKAIAALAQLRGAAGSPLLEKLLSDSDVAVRKAAIRTLGEVSARDAVPALLATAAAADVRGDVITALIAMPDRRALGLYLDALLDPNPSLRDAARVALGKIKDSIEPDIIELQQRNELPGKVRGELQGVFSAPTPILAWQIVGPWSKNNPPKLDYSGAADLNAPVLIGDKQAAWKSLASADPAGRFSLGSNQFAQHEGVWALAYTTIDASEAGPRQFVLGSDDYAQLYVNGEKVYEFGGNRGWSADSGRGQFELKQGRNHIYFLTGNDTGPWDFSLAVGGKNPRLAFLYENVPAKLDMVAYREHAAKNAGDAAKGRAIFADLKGVGCIKCHAVSGEGGKVGPDLVGIGGKYPREELIRSVLEPSNRVAAGFQVTTVVTDAGKIVQGLVKSDTDEAVEIIDAEGRVTKIPKTEVEEQRASNLSLMPNGLKDGLTLEAFADVIAYLESLKQAK